MPTRSDLDLLDAFIRKAANEPIKHHEVSMALQALERIERAIAPRLQPLPRGVSGEHGSLYMVEVDQTQNMLSDKQLAEVERGLVAGDRGCVAYVPLLGDAYRRLHRLGEYAEEKSQLDRPAVEKK